MSDFLYPMMAAQNPISNSVSKWRWPTKQEIKIAVAC